MPKSFYIAGKMSGLPDWGFPAFFKAEEYLTRNVGCDIINPARHDLEEGYVVELPDGGYDTTPKFSRNQVLRWDLAQIAKNCSAIVLLEPHWRDSEGVSIELAVAKALGLTIYTFDPETEKFRFVPGQKVIGLTGWARSGKDTVADIMVEEHGYEKVSFADSLRDYVYATDERYANILKERGHDYEKAKASNPYVRKAHQRAGKAARETIHEDVWLISAQDKIERSGGLVVIPDVRYQNEADMIRKLGGIVVRVDRPGVGPANDFERDNHAPPDTRWVARNNGTFEDLAYEIQLVLGNV